MNEIILQCTEVTNDTGHNSKMFFPGRYYRATRTGYKDCQYSVTDELGHERIFGKDEMRFIVANPGDLCDVAKFKEVES